MLAAASSGGLVEWLRLVFRLWILEPDCCMASFMGSRLSADYMTLVFHTSLLCFLIRKMGRG